tara:strand:- start:3604 stop:3954 length:351 start_codon:yes stop_codon:yes gene_type:complete
MGTHAIIGVKHTDGSIDGCYVHYDGYPDHMISALEDYVYKHTTTGLTILIKKAQEKGGIRFFNCYDFQMIKKETMMLEGDPWAINEKTWMLNNCGASYRYIVDYSTGNVSYEASKR